MSCPIYKLEKFISSGELLVVLKYINDYLPFVQALSVLLWILKSWTASSTTWKGDSIFILLVNITS